ncbi:unnamed protein product [Adineta steineri]|uniref:G-protein coupled receptors family 1 profile domain-containing protein n=1 Tax=Adineta steineri TaxID=433720 RepID=A0A814IIS6_9BILA|nr:unnamed protein product [Adineta steineri]CAF1023994.1 unnamed protein product [Adineta steineri]
MILCTTLAIGLALIFLLIIICDTTCHTVSMMLVANSCLTEFIFGSIMLSSAIFTFQNDLQKTQYQDSLCIIRGYLGYVVTFLQNYSYLLQATYRYITVIYSNRLSWQTVRFQIKLISSMWIFGILCPIPYLINNKIIYDINNQICQMSFQLSFLTIYNIFIVYIIPILMIILVYFALFQHVQKMNRLHPSINTLNRIQGELKIVRQIIILILGIIAIGFPYVLFVFWSFFTNLPKYYFRITNIFVDVSLVFVMIIMFEYTEPLQTSLIDTNILILNSNV